jgi:Ca-activated chloride channel family protein
MNHDPRITAYATGELEGREREAFEVELAASDRLHREVESMSGLAKQLASATKPTDRFTADERARLLSKCADTRRSRTVAKNSLKVVLWTTVGVAAACLVVFVGFVGLVAMNSGSGSGPWANDAYYPGCENQAPGAQAAAAPATESWSYKDPQSESSPQKQLLSETPAITAQEATADSVTPSDTTPILANDNTRITAFAPAPRIRRPLPKARSISLQGYSRQRVPQAAQGPVDAPTISSPSNFNTEAYAAVRENEFVAAKENPLSTFSIDVDTASYSNVRRFLNDEIRPPVGAIRTEELINYFRYNYSQPTGDDPFSVNLEVSRAPWNPERELVRIGLKGREVPTEERGPANLVFLIDVSGSMDESNKLPLLQRSLSALVENLSDEDRVAIVTYAGSSGLVLAPTEGAKNREILEAISNLRAGGSTHGSEGIRLAYETAREQFREDGNNRVILCTDGDFNVGVTNESELQKLIEKERESGVFLSVLGFGTGNLNDSTMELLANKGNGSYAYIDSISEGRKVLVEQMGSTLFTIAKDVKIQVEFNPARVAGYRLIGYENRLLAKEDFNDDKKDAGEIGAGHTVTALYEIIPAGQPIPNSPSVDSLKYQHPEQDADAASTSNELLTVKLRYKAPDGDKSKLMEIPLKADDIPSFDAAPEDFRFASAVAAFGMKLRGSPDAGKISWPEIQDIARGALGNDPGSYRAEFLTLVEKAKAIEEAERR